MLSSLSCFPFYPKDPSQGGAAVKRPPSPLLLITSTFRQFEVCVWGGIWGGIMKISPLAIATTAEALLQILAPDKSQTVVS